MELTAKMFEKIGISNIGKKEEEFPKLEVLSFKKMAEQMIEDAYIGTFQAIIYKLSPQKTKPKNYEKILFDYNWIMEDDKENDRFTFSLLCEILGNDSERIRNNFLYLEKQGYDKSKKSYQRFLSIKPPKQYNHKSHSKPLIIHLYSK